MSLHLYHESLYGILTFLYVAESAVRGVPSKSVNSFLTTATCSSD